MAVKDDALQGAVDAFRASDLFFGLDVRPDELHALMEGADRLSKLFPIAGEDDSVCVFRMGDLDVRHVIAARAVSASDSALNPDPELAVDARIQTRVIRRSNRLAGLPPEAEPEATNAGVAARKRAQPDGDARRAKRTKVDAAPRPPAYTYQVHTVVPAGPLASSSSPDRAVGTSSVTSVSRNEPVYLESLQLVQGMPCQLSGSVLIRAMGDGQSVAVLYTVDEWQSSNEAAAHYVASMPALPQLFGNGVISGGAGWQRYAFQIPVEGQEEQLSVSTMECAVRYTAVGERGGEWWDRNAGAGYRVSLSKPTWSALGGGSKPGRRVGKARSRGHRRRRAHLDAPALDTADTADQAAGQSGADQQEPEDRQSPGDEYEYRIADFTQSDLVYRKPGRLPAIPPVPPIPPAPQSHRTHDLEHDAARRDRYRSGLPMEQLRPDLVEKSDGSPALAIETLNRTIPGWRGSVPRHLIQQVQRLWGRPGLKDALSELFLVPYTGVNSAFADMNGRTVLLRTTPIKERDGVDLVEEFAVDSYKFAQMCPIRTGDRTSNKRGQHWACVAGHHRQYAKAPYRTRFQRDYEPQIAWYFRPGGPAARVTAYLTGIIENRFPAIAERMRKNHEWHKEHSGISPMFGLFWNFCLNAPSPEGGVSRVFCKPHVDAMNCAVLLCSVFIIWSKGWLGEEEWSWLVVWELGIAIQCPRGCFVIYPSALFFHFNIRVVKCPKGQRPTPANSTELPRPVGEWVGGRASAVWFTQSTMHSQTSERDPKTGRMPDYEETARRCFPLHGDGESDDADGEESDDAGAESDSYYLEEL